MGFSLKCGPTSGAQLFNEKISRNAAQAVSKTIFEAQDLLNEQEM
jgi:hypothetical protein